MSRARDQRIRQNQKKELTTKKQPAPKNQSKKNKERVIEDVWQISKPASYEKKKTDVSEKKSNTVSQQNKKARSGQSVKKQGSAGRARAKQAKQPQSQKPAFQQKKKTSLTKKSIDRSRPSVVKSSKKPNQSFKNLVAVKLKKNSTGSMLAFIMAMILITVVIVIICVADKEPEPIVEEPVVSQVTEPEKPKLDPYPEGTKPFSLGSYTQLINKFHSLPEDYKPVDLVMLSLPSTGDQYLREEAASALTELFQASKADGIEFVCCSGYRSYETQAVLHTNYVNSIGQEEADRTSALPGYSEHQSGLAMDLTCEAMNYTLEESFIDTPEGQWLAAHAHEYGFIIRYPKGSEPITGYVYEPWHIRFLGKDVAKAVYDSGKTYEEYLGIFE